MSASIPAPKRKLWLYAKADWRALNEFFDKFNWNLCFLDINIDSAAEMVSNIILLGMRMYIPCKNKSIKPGAGLIRRALTQSGPKRKRSLTGNQFQLLLMNCYAEEARNRCNAILLLLLFINR